MAVLIYGLIFGGVGVICYLYMAQRDDSKKSNEFEQAKQEYLQIAKDVQRLKNAYTDKSLSDNQRLKIRQLHEKAVVELKEMSEKVHSLNQQL